MPFFVKLYVNPRAAILHGKADFGVKLVEVTDVNLDNNIDLRMELGTVALNDETVGQHENDLEAYEATINELFRLLHHRVASREAIRNEVSEHVARKRIEAARAQEIAAVKKREDDTRSAKRLLSIQRWVADRGTDSQKKRLTEGVLPEEEILEDITNHLCEDLTIDQSNEKYVKIAVDDVCACACVDNVQFDVGPATALSEEQYDTLVETRNEAGTALALLHRAKCPMCDCPAVEKLSIRVEMQWNGVDVVREYSL